MHWLCLYQQTVEFCIQLIDLTHVPGPHVSRVASKFNYGTGRIKKIKHPTKHSHTGAYISELHTLIMYLYTFITEILWFSIPPCLQGSDNWELIFSSRLSTCCLLGQWQEKSHINISDSTEHRKPKAQTCYIAYTLNAAFKGPIRRLKQFARTVWQYTV